MKKQIHEQLLLLANQILEKDRTFETVSVKKLVGELYEKLSVLEYLENQLECNQETQQEESLDSKSFREENWFTEPEPVPQPEHKEDLIEPLMEKIKDIVAQMPKESERIDSLLEDLIPKTEGSAPVEDNGPKTEKPSKNDLEEFAANYQQMPEFERKPSETFPPSNAGQAASKNFTESRAKPLNETINKGLNIGLNDRLAFVKHLFGGQSEDYTRVLSQINTMESFDEAHKFLTNNVKPDYNNWDNKEEYSERFMAIIEKRFN